MASEVVFVAQGQGRIPPSSAPSPQGLCSDQVSTVGFVGVDHGFENCPRANGFTLGREDRSYASR